MRKKTLKLNATLLALCVGCSVGMTACGGTTIKRDNTKTYLDVEVFNGGYGYKWLQEVAKKFEEEYSDYQIGDKVGVKIDIHPERNQGTNVSDNIASATNEIYFVEQTSTYYSFAKSGHLLDISDIVTENIASQGHSIESTLNADLRKYFGIDQNGETKYYGLPYSTAFVGLNYDAEFFYNNGLFLVREFDEIADQGNETVNDDSVIQSIPASQKNAQGEYASLVTEGGQSYYKTVKGDYLSQGPDGKYGTSDDGTPATYNEFFSLCKYMWTEKTIYPFIYSGKAASGYIRWLMNQIAVSYEGYDQALLNYTLDGTLTNLISVDSNGKVTELPDETLTPDNSSKNAVMINKSAGRYYAWQFFEKMVANDGEFLAGEALNNSDHLVTQESFMLSPKDPEKAAFLVDGVWWENEADLAGTFKAVSSFGEKYKKENRQFKLLSMPKQNRDLIGTGNTFVDTGYQVAFILDSIADEKEELAKKFLQFCFTDEANAAFTTSTGGIPRPFNYELTDAQYGQMTSYGRSVWDLVKGNEKALLFPVSTSEYYLANQSLLNPSLMFYTNIGNVEYMNVVEVIKDKKYGAKKAFDGLYTYASSKGM